MTTIAYHHAGGVIAVDGMVTAGDLITSRDFQKWRVVGEEVWFICGAVADYGRLIAYHAGELSGKPDYPVSCSALIAVNGLCYEAGVTSDGEPWRSVAPYSVAVGSGRDFALSAMDHGKNAIEAVKYAATRDTGTGGKISAFDVSSNHWLSDNFEVRLA